MFFGDAADVYVGSSIALSADGLYIKAHQSGLGTGEVFLLE